MKLALGTAQFGLDYGVANRSGKVRFDEARQIVNLARGAEVDLIDTAVGYGDSEVALGNIGLSDFRIVSKVGERPAGADNVHDWLFGQVRNSLSRLGVSRLYGVLLHRPPSREDSSVGQLAEALNSIKEAGLVEKVGVSIYSPDELSALLSTVPVDIVQSPFNIFDRRMLSEGWFERLKERDIEVHVRSIFLQGLLLMDADRLPAYFSNWSGQFKKYHEWLAQLEFKSIEACIRYVLSVSWIDRVVVGVDSANQLTEILKYFRKPAVEAPDYLSVLDEKLINPSVWQI